MTQIRVTNHAEPCRCGCNQPACQPPEDGCHLRTQSAIHYEGLRQLNNIQQHFSAMNQRPPHNFPATLAVKQLTSLRGVTVSNPGLEEAIPTGFTWLLSQSTAEYRVSALTL